MIPFFGSAVIPIDFLLHLCSRKGYSIVPSKSNTINSLNNSSPCWWLTNWSAPLVKQLFKGVYNSRPSQPRYAILTMFRLQLLGHIAQLGYNESLSLKHLSLKLVTLKSLAASANRVSELNTLDLHFAQYTVNKVVFKSVSLTKKHQTGALLKEIVILQMTNCVQFNTWSNIWSSSQFQSVVPRRVAPLFVYYAKPHKPVATQHLAH